MDSFFDACEPQKVAATDQVGQQLASNGAEASE